MNMSDLLYEHQKVAIKKMKNGCILCGGVGSGKSRTALAYYILSIGGAILPDLTRIPDERKDLVIITTARKRDTREWVDDMLPFGLNPKEVIIDSWNNIKKYQNMNGAFFIFDEQRVVGSGTWVKSFLNITRKNSWILLSATPGDNWLDYVPVFIANGFFKNKSEFIKEHVIYSRFSKFPKVEKYMNQGRLIKFRNNILVDMPFERHTVKHDIPVVVEFDRMLYKNTIRTRWDPFNDEPIVNAASLCYTLRKIVNGDKSRIDAIFPILEKHRRVIIFYNFDYELEILRNIDYGKKVKVAEWNGHKHDDIPNTKYWVYLVQYTAGAEGWNCTSCDCIIFYSMNYSYKIKTQAKGRIDRLNTLFTDLYYYEFKSTSGIDMSIQKAFLSKKKFNEKDYISWEEERNK